MDKTLEYIKKLTWEPHDMPMTPHLIFCFLDAATIELKKLIGSNYYYFTTYIKDDYARFGFTREDWSRLGKFFFKKVKSDKHFLPAIQKKYKKSIKDFKTLLNKIDKTELNTLSDLRLSKIYKKFYNSYVNQYAIPSVANAIDYYTQIQISAQLKKIINNEEKFNRYLTILNSPVQESYTNIERNILLKISRTITRNNKLKKLFINKEAQEIKQILQEDKERILNLIGNHAKKYYWLNNNYAKAEILDEAYFIDEIKNILISSLSPQKEIEDIKTGLEKIRKGKKKLIKKLKLDFDFRLLIKLQEQSIAWRDERKMYNQIGDYYHFLFLKKSTKRLSFGLNELLYTSPDELINGLKGKTINRQTIKSRKESLLIITANSKRIFITGQKADKINTLLYSGSNINPGVLKGSPASLGRVEGTVKIIIKPDEFSKMKKNDILVTTMTRPEFVPVMKKASGIITDEGGVTCHAAIISRELGIPCIIGTKVATQVLKDNDKIILNANAGIVEKIK